MNTKIYMIPIILASIFIGAYYLFFPIVEQFIKAAWNVSGLVLGEL